jgi:hypothetical protein
MEDKYALEGSGVQCIGEDSRTIFRLSSLCSGHQLTEEAVVYVALLYGVSRRRTPAIAGQVRSGRKNDARGTRPPKARPLDNRPLGWGVQRSRFAC